MAAIWNVMGDWVSGFHFVKSSHARHQMLSSFGEWCTPFKSENFNLILIQPNNVLGPHQANSGQSDTVRCRFFFVQTIEAKWSQTIARIVTHHHQSTLITFLLRWLSSLFLSFPLAWSFNQDTNSVDSSPIWNCLHRQSVRNCFNQQLAHSFFPSVYWQMKNKSFGH